MTTSRDSLDRMGVLSADEIRWMKQRLPNQSKDVVMETFGISSNTWQKIKMQAPVRPSLISRLRNRIPPLDQSA